MSNATIGLVKKLIILVTIHILLLSVLRFTAWPENLLWPYLNFHGLNYYRDIFVLYPPFYWLTLNLTYGFFGLSLVSLKLLSYVVIIVTDILLYLAAGRKISALLFYIPLQIFFDGNGIWVDHLLAPLFLGVYLALTRKKYFLLGLLLGLALITKQTAVYILVPIIIFLRSDWRKIFPALVLPLIFTVVFLIFTNGLQGFFNSTIHYILTYHTRDPYQSQWPTISQFIATCVVFLPAIFTRNRQLQFFTFFGALGIFTRFEYFHLQPALPFLALIFSSTFIIFPFYLIFTIIFVKFFIRDLSNQNRFFTPDYYTTAKEINSYVPSGGRTLFINTWDHYYYLTGTLPAGNFFVPSAPWTLNYDGIQNKLISSTPEYIFYNSCFATKNICYEPEKFKNFLVANYKRISKLSDGTGVFQYNPVGLR